MIVDDGSKKKGRFQILKDAVGKTVDKAKTAISDVAEREDTKNVIDWSKKAGTGLKDQAVQLGKDIQNSELGKSAAKGAAVGAVAGVPLPIVGPISGAVIGAAAGAYLNFRYGKGDRKNEALEAPSDNGAGGLKSSEVLDAIAKLEQLRKDGAITDAEFQGQKAKLLDRL